MSEYSNSIVINLDKLESTEVRGKNELIFQEQYDLLVKKIRRKAKENKARLSKKECEENKKQNDEDRGVPSCFFIAGSRGSGKSTLMRTVRAELIKCKDDEKGLYPLADVDPTELGKGENFFLYLLGRVYKVLDDCFKKRVNCDDSVDEIRTAMQDLRKLSGGLQVLMDAEEALKKSNTPDSFLENCVENCADSMLLRKKLCELLGKVAKIVGKEIFLITIDDADLSFSKCEDVLEYVRKYMQTPRLVFLFAGDMQLYMHVVRGMHIGNFKENQLKYDKPYEKSREKMIDLLQEQYLEKLFPSDNRVRTLTLKEILANVGDFKVQRGENDAAPQHFFFFVQTYLSPFMKPREVEIFLDVLCDMPLRSVFFFLRYLGKYEGTMQPADLSSYVLTGIQNLILSSLSKYNVDYERLGAGTTEQIQKSIFSFLDATQQWNTDLSMLSASADSSAKFVALYLSGIVGINTQTLREKLSYWCACFPAWQAVRELYLQTNNGQKSHELVESCLKLGNGNEQSKWANLACAAMSLQEGGVFSYRRGTICLFNNDRTQDNEKGHAARLGMISLVHKFSDMMESGTKDEKLFSLAFHSCLCRIDDECGSNYYLSIYHLLMKMVEWLNLASMVILSQKKMPKENAESILRERIRKYLEAAQVIPYTQRLQRNESHAVVVERKYHIVKTIKDEAIVDEMFEWIKKCPDISFASSVFDFSRSWETFMARCEELTNVYQPIYEDKEFCPRAGTLLLKYMEAAEIALSSILTSGENTLLSYLTTFPLWGILKNPPEKCIKLLNSAFIGDYVDEAAKRKIAESWRIYQEYRQDIVKKEQDRDLIIQKSGKTRELLQEAQQRREERQQESKLKKKKNEIDRADLSEQQKTIESVLNEESEVRQHLVELEHQERIEGGVLQKHQRKSQLLAEAIISTPLNELPQTSFLSLVDRTKNKIKQSRSAASRKQHEDFLKSLQELYESLSLDERSIPLAELYSLVRKEEMEMSENHDKTVKSIEQHKLHLRSIGQRRELEEKRLKECVERLNLSRKMAEDAEVSYEISKMRYEYMKNEVDEMNAQLDSINKDLQDTQVLCDEAKKQYEKAKESDETE